jgi:hypothetical protein
MSDKDKHRRKHYIEHNQPGCMICDVYDKEACKAIENVDKVIHNLVFGDK